MEHDRPYRPRKRKPREGSLRQYRLYFIGGDGHISHSHEFEAKDDTDAMQIAEAWLEGRAAELWVGTRKIKSWEADPNRGY